MANDYVYADLDSSLARNRSGNFIIKYDKEAIIQGVKAIFSTVSGERVRSRLGSSLVSLLFQPMDQDTVNSMRNLIRKSVEQNDPRISVQQVTITPNYDENTYDIQVIMSVRKITQKIKFETRLRSFST